MGERRCRIVEGSRKHEVVGAVFVQKRAPDMKMPVHTPASCYGRHAQKAAVSRNPKAPLCKAREITECRGEAIRAPQTAPLEADGDPKEQRDPETLLKRDPKPRQT